MCPVKITSASRKGCTNLYPDARNTAMFNPAFCTGVLTVVLVSVASDGLAIPRESVPNPRRTYGGWVTDRADMLAPETEAELNRQITVLEAKNSSEIAVVTVPDIFPSLNSKAFATSLFNAWGIGKKGKDNGVLFLVSQGDRRVEIVTGKGIAPLLPDRQVSEILRQEVTPRFKQRQFDAGVLAGTQTLIAQISPYSTADFAKAAIPAPNTTPPQPSPRESIAAQPTLPRVQRPEVTGSSSASPLPATFRPTVISDFDNLLRAILGGLGAGMLTVGGILLYRRCDRTLLAPEGESQVQRSEMTGRERFHCKTCKQLMERVTAADLSHVLSPPQQTAQKLGSMAYNGWRCKSCQPSANGIHLRKTVMDAEQFCRCPTCDERTARRCLNTVQKPTWNQVGSRLTTYTCHCCDDTWQAEETIPCLALPKHAVTIDPIGRSRINNFPLFQPPESVRPTHCSQCHHPMERINLHQLEHLLQEPERVAQSLGNISFIGWKCPTCQSESDSANLHVRAYVLSNQQHHCPHCQELTIEETSRITQSATPSQEGKRQITKRCHCCSFVEEQWDVIPRCAPVSYGSSAGSRGSSSEGSAYRSSASTSNSWSSSDSSSSSSDFGGGSSSGSGSGDSW
jgi:uncharacterized membrane protein YgcG